MSLFKIVNGCKKMAQNIKEHFTKMIYELPDNISSDEIVYHTYVKSQIMKGKKQLLEGKGIPHSEIKAEIDQWLK